LPGNPASRWDREARHRIRSMLLGRGGSLGRRGLASAGPSARVAPGARAVLLERGGREPLSLDCAWLRDHCRQDSLGLMYLLTVWLNVLCPCRCLSPLSRADGRYSWESHQRTAGLVLPAIQVAARRAEVGTALHCTALWVASESLGQVEAGSLRVAWEDGSASSFPVTWLELHYTRPPPQVQPGGREVVLPGSWATQNIDPTMAY
jgi:hypothetical protein